METEARLLLTYHTLPAAFCELVVPSLEQSEEKYALPLGLCMRILPARQADQHKLLLASVSTPEGELRASALRSAPHYLLVQSEPLCELALELLAKSLAERGAVLPGVTGVSETSDTFARCWEARTGAAAKLETRQRAYALREVNPVRKPVGTKQQALPEHAPLILEWINAMSAETASGNQAAWTLEDVSACIQDGVFYLWCAGGEPAAMAFYNRPTRRSVAISGVYTAPEKRGQGFATALVAGMCAQALADGREFITLFTDVENPVSNAVYQHVGFYPVCDYHQYRF
jgi:predicted GNAT family acetyltransferase